jgi:hypothetical protein
MRIPVILKNKIQLQTRMIFFWFRTMLFSKSHIVVHFINKVSQHVFNNDQFWRNPTVFVMRNSFRGKTNRCAKFFECRVGFFPEQDYFVHVFCLEGYEHKIEKAF